jgi:predicted RNase H-related nuclease YkuK (DUF458 family)
MRPISAISLFLVFVIPFVGGHLFLQYAQDQHQSDTYAALENGSKDQELILLVFTDQELTHIKWEHDKEFEWNGEMYDVVSEEERDGQKAFWCWKDHKDTRINKQRESLALNAMSNHPDEDGTEAQLKTQYKVHLDIPQDFNLKSSILVNHHSAHFWTKTLTAQSEPTPFAPPPDFS